MNRVSHHALCRAALVSLATTAVMACGDSGQAPLGPDHVSAAANGGGKQNGVSVTATNPGFGHQGDAGKTVVITGSGFRAGAVASFERGGAADPGITVHGTQFVSATQLIATISIASDATLELYDVAVTNPDRTKGIGTLMFEVTTATPAPELQIARRVNDNGELSGTMASGGTAYFSTMGGVAEQVAATGTGFGIAMSGDVIVGTGGSGGNLAYLYVRQGPIGSPWTATALPADPASTSSAAKSLVTEPGSGQTLAVGGYEFVPSGRNGSLQRPVVWHWQAGTSSWLRIVLPTGSPTTPGEVVDLSATGIAIGMVNGRAAVWTPNGSGGYQLGLIGANGSRATGIDGGGTIITGRAGTGGSLSAVYWRFASGAWSSPIVLPGGCDVAKGVSDEGRIVLNSCPFGARTYPAYIDPPYATASALRGLGPKNTIGQISGISPSGQYVAGQATVGGIAQAIYWSIF